MEETTALTTIEQSLTNEGYGDHHKNLASFIKSQLKETKTGENGDYGVIPYTKKKSLLKPGAEKLCRRFGLIPSFELLASVEDFEKGIVFYKYRCSLTEFRTGKKAGEAIRSCNSKEKKHASKSVYEAANTVDAVAQKRALVAATVQALAASEIFDADTSSEFEDTAPKRSVSAEEDPRRAQLFARLYATVSERGFSNTAIHNAAKREYGIGDSLTELSNQQIEEIIEKMVTTYDVVEKGERPRRLGAFKAEAVKEEKKEIPQAVEAEVIEEAAVRMCPNSQANPDCKGKMDLDDVNEECASCRMKMFIKTGALSKGVKRA